MVLRLRYTAVRLLLAALAALALSRGAAAQDSRLPLCRVASPAPIASEPFVTAWLDIGNYVCGDEAEEPSITTIVGQVDAVASAIAEDFAEITSACQAGGNAEVRAKALAHVEARAESVGGTVNEILASAEVCGRCPAAASALTEAAQVLIAKAVAEAWTQLFVLSDGGAIGPGPSPASSSIVVETISTALAGVAATIRAGANDGCSAAVISAAQVGDYLPNCDNIIDESSGTVIDRAIDDVLEVGADVTAYACNGVFGDVEEEGFARATASALAAAVVQADAFCAATGGDDTLACGLAEADVRAVASAMAEAFAAALQEAIACGCDLSQPAEESALAEIWVEAMVNGYADSCGAGDRDVVTADLRAALEERMLTATARVIAFAIADARDGNTCGPKSSPCAFTSAQCVGGANGRCYSAGFDFVLPCCDPDHLCIRRNANDSRCRPRSSRVPSFWDGSVHECTLDLL